MSDQELLALENILIYVWYGIGVVAVIGIAIIIAFGVMDMIPDPKPTKSVKTSKKD